MQSLFFKVGCLVSLIQRILMITPLPFAHTAHRYYRSIFELRLREIALGMSWLR